MPNHVTTRCIVTGPSTIIAKFCGDLFEVSPTEDGDKNKDSLFDFQKIIPMPEVLKGVEASTISEYGLKLIITRAEYPHSFFESGVGMPASWITKFHEETGIHHMGAVAKCYLAAHPEYESAGKLRLRAILETGFASWYEWNISNWGTKWNSYGVEIINSIGPNLFEFKFETAWSFPTPIFAKLADDYPELTFDIATFDEGHNFAGVGQFGNMAAPPFSICEATNDLYERVYGYPYESETEED